MYSFLFDRKSLILLVAGLATVGCLLFVAGLLTGVFWAPAAPGATLASAPPGAMPASLFPSSQPCPPAGGQVADTERPAPEPELEEPVPMLEADAHPQPRRVPREAVRQAVLQPSPAEPPSRREEKPADADLNGQEPAAPPASEPASALASLETAAPAAAPAAPPMAIDPAPAASQPALKQEPVYSLQIGAFRQSENSDRIARDLQNRGYDAYVVTEKGKRPLRTVRVGRYTARDEALRAAQYFEQREGVQVIVRQLGSGAVPLTSW
jgi:cell division septation protein DedD